jgi:hypothetical protein
MEKLIELHDIIKNHPYRVNKEDKYLDSYKKLLYKLTHKFYEVLRDSKYKNARNMIHDFNASISNIGKENYDDSMAVAHVEKCLGVIHIFIDTNKIEFFWTYYTGYNHLELPRNKKYIWDDSTNKYFLFCTEQEFDKSISWLQSKLPIEKDWSSKMYQPALDWVKEQKEHWYH